jgi:hypothetical protein
LANDISANPWKIDTASASVIYKGPVKIDNVVWSDYTTTGDTLVITNAAGKQIIKAVIGTEIANQWTFGKIGWVEGLIVSSLTHGEVMIMIGAGK